MINKPGQLCLEVVMWWSVLSCVYVPCCHCMYGIAEIMAEMLMCMCTSCDEGVLTMCYWYSMCGSIQYCVCTQCHVTSTVRHCPQSFKKELLDRKYVDLCTYIKLFVSEAHTLGELYRGGGRSGCCVLG